MLPSAHYWNFWSNIALLHYIDNTLMQVWKSIGSWRVMNCWKFLLLLMIWSEWMMKSWHRFRGSIFYSSNGSMLALWYLEYSLLHDGVYTEFMVNVAITMSWLVYVEAINGSSLLLLVLKRIYGMKCSLLMLVDNQYVVDQFYDT